MGHDKAMLRWGTTSLLDHMLQLLSTVVNPVRVVGRDELPDRIPGKGPLGGILTALDVTDRQKNLFLAVDLPLLTPDFLSMFHSRFQTSSRQLLACRVDEDFPLCLGVDRSLTGEVERRVQSGKLAIRNFIEETDPEIIEETELQALGYDRWMFGNINTPEDWQSVLKRREG